MSPTTSSAACLIGGRQATSSRATIKRASLRDRHSVALFQRYIFEASHFTPQPTQTLHYPAAWSVAKGACAYLVL